MNIKSMISKGKKAFEKAGILAGKTLIKQIEKLEISLKNRQESALREQQNISKNRAFGDTEISDDIRAIIDNNVDKANRMHYAFEAKVDRMNISEEEKTRWKEHLKTQRDYINIIQSGIAHQYKGDVKKGDINGFKKAMENFTYRVRYHTNDFVDSSPNIATILHETFESGDLDREAFFKWLGRKLSRNLTPEKRQRIEEIMIWYGMG